MPDPQERQQRRIIIDTDPGIDDAVAILLALSASPAELDIVGVVAVAGNLPLSITERNARAILELASGGQRSAIPVFAGCPRPIDCHTAVTAADVHGDSGLGGLLLPAPTSPLQREHGVVWLIDMLRAGAVDAKPVTLCALGPLTNIAMALVMAPDIAAGIAELVIMGGGTRGNMTPAAEFNIYCDPQAAAVVFGSGVPITLVPLDVTNLTASTPARVEAIAQAGTRCAAAVARLLTPEGGWSGTDRSSVTIHDACVIAYLLAPELFGTAADAHVAIETQSALTRGMTVIDTRGRSGRPRNARVLNTIDVVGLYRLLAQRLARLP